MIVYQDCVTFTVLGKEINLYSENLSFARNTVAEIDSLYYHLGSELVNIASAIFAWQDHFNREMTSKELEQVMNDNHLLEDDDAATFIKRFRRKNAR